MMKRLFAGRFIRSIGYLLSVNLVALLFFFGLRVALFIATDYDFPKEISEDYALQSVAFLRGLWFDNVIACYILLLPLAVFWIAGWFGYTARWLYRSSAFFFIFFYSLCFIISAANIPYFAYFFKPINSSIFNWFDYAGTTAGMVFGETSYYFPIALGLAAIAAFAYITLRLSRTFFLLSRNAAPPANRWKATAFTFVTGAALIGLCFFGIRGRRGYNPIKVSQAYYCNDAFLNQLGINPVFNLMTSAIDDNRKENRLLHLMAEDEAIARVQTLLGRKGMDGISPIARRVEADSLPTRRNVVVILMESMSAHLMQTFGHETSLTPFLDSLWQQSLSFSHFYSSGIHTNHGMYSSLYSFPAMMKRNAMKGSVIPVYSGLPTVLKENGYHNMFFMTHESQYDNMNAFFRTNGFDDIYSQENYPADKVVNGFGVQDDFLFQYALPVLDRQAQSGQPFFSVLLTISNHPPYIIPPYFHPRSRTTEEQIVEYADWSIRNFMTEALKRPWADNTLFVLLGDHGKLVGTPECESPGHSSAHRGRLRWAGGFGPDPFGPVRHRLRAKRFRCGFAEREASLYVFHSRQPHRCEGLVTPVPLLSGHATGNPIPHGGYDCTGCRGRPGFPRHEAIRFCHAPMCRGTGATATNPQPSSRGQAVESGFGSLLPEFDILSKSQIQAYENVVFAALLDKRHKYAILMCLPINKKSACTRSGFHSDIRHAQPSASPWKSVSIRRVIMAKRHTDDDIFRSPNRGKNGLFLLSFHPFLGIRPRFYPPCETVLRQMIFHSPANEKFSSSW